MTLTVDWDTRIVNSDASITDIVAFKDEIRNIEDDNDGMLNPVIITYKLVDIGGGAFLHFVDFINNYRLRFPVAGNYSIVGNINAEIFPDPGVFVDRLRASAFATVGSDVVSNPVTSSSGTCECLPNAQDVTFVIDNSKVEFVIEDLSVQAQIFSDDDFVVSVDDIVYEINQETTWSVC